MYVWFEPHSVRNILARELEECFHNLYDHIQNLPGLPPLNVAMETTTLPDRIRFKITSDEPIESDEFIYINEIPCFNKIMEESARLGVPVSVNSYFFVLFPFHFYFFSFPC